MIRKLHIMAGTLGLILAVSLAGAQTRGGGVAARTSPAPPRSAARISSSPATGFAGGARAVRPRAANRILRGGHVASGFTSFNNSVSFGTGIGVPGLGFDYPHLAAISGGLQNGAPQGFQRRRNAGQGYFVPIFFGGSPYFPYVDDSLDYEQAEPPGQPVQPQPQIIVIQQPVPAAVAQQVAAAQPAEAQRDGAQSSQFSPAAPEAPVRNVGEFILIRKDGRVFFANAFSVVGTQLRYISPEGILQKFPVTELDSDATQQMNEARGNTVQIYN